MSNFTFLTEEQCFGNDKLDILEKRGTKAAITDFYVLLGGWVTNYHVDNDSSLEERTGYYWTKSDCEKSYAYAVDDDGYKNYYNVKKRIGGARPVLAFSSIDSIPTNGEGGKRARDGILEVEYGYYPQKAVSKNMQKILEQEYIRGNISRTRNIYTTDSKKYDDYTKQFEPKTHEEYEFNEKRYIRVEANSDFGGNRFILSNGEQYRDGDNVWVEVLPVKWLVDEKNCTMITEKIIFSGVQFNREANYNIRDFEETDIKKFMDTYLAKDLVQTRGRVEKKSNKR